MRVTKPICLSIELNADGSLPTEFRLFHFGVNQTAKGPLLFDLQAANEVMADYRARNVDLAIDLEHQMLDDRTSADPTAKDARGWCKLSVRPGTELWATDVKWTDDGIARLTGKRQRYVSPALTYDAENNNRILSILNIAITSMPATYNPQALMAANIVKGKLSMDASLVKNALDALQGGDADAAAEILKSLIAAAAADSSGQLPDSEEQAEESMAAKPPAPPAPDSMPPAAPTAKAPHAPAAPADEDDTKKKLSLLQKELAERDAADRVALCTELVTLGAEFPSTVWEAGATKQLKAHWLSMPVKDLRSHVEGQRTARKNAPKRLSAPKTLSGVSAETPQEKTINTRFGVVTLSASELAAIARNKGDEGKYAERKAHMLSASKGSK